MIASALPRPLTAGSVDNAVLRADGTGGTTLQNSGLIVEDTIVSFSTVTGDATTDVITATGSAFVNAQPVRFTVLAGGAGVNTTTNYYVRDVSGATFKLETSIGGGAINFTTNITAGTLLTGHSVSVNVTISENTTATNSDLVLTPKGTGALILGPKPDGTATGGNARGLNAVDLQRARSNATQVCSGSYAFIGSGNQNTIGAGDMYAAICSGSLNAIGSGASGQYTFIGAGVGNSSTAQHGVIGGGYYNSASGIYSAILGGTNARADRRGMQAHANSTFGNAFANNGDAQRARFVLNCKTTTNTGVEMALDGATTYLGIPSGKVIAMTINISGVKSDGLAVAHYLRQYCVKNVSGTSTQVYAPVTIGTDNAAGTSIALSANDADDTMRILVTGVASETWRWVASIDAIEIGYGI